MALKRIVDVSHVVDIQSHTIIDDDWGIGVTIYYKINRVQNKFDFYH
jgi:hypothetical protein